MQVNTAWRPKDPGSAITHFIGFAASAAAGIPLLAKASQGQDSVRFWAMAVFLAGLLLLYAASTCYHSFDLSPTANLRLKKFDHMMISVLIAGTYTPVCLLVLPLRAGLPLLIGIWTAALAGIFIKAFWVTCPRWFSSVLYLLMGWLCVFALPALIRVLSGPAFRWLLAGGIFYTVGAVIYALKLPDFNRRHPNFGTHEIFHLFVMAGSFCHYMLFYLYVA